jgi:cell division protein FtsZ
VLYSGVACITDLMVKEGLINLDFADVRAVMREMGKAMMGTGEASGEKRALRAAEAAIANPLLDETSMKGAQGLLVSITGGKDLTLYEVDEAATRIREEVDSDANIIVGATFDESLEGIVRVSVVATGIDTAISQQRQAAAAAAPAAPAKPMAAPAPAPQTTASTASRLAELTQNLRANTARLQERMHHHQEPARPVQAAPVEPPPAPVMEAAPAPVMPNPLPPAGIEDVTIRPIAPKPSLFLEPVIDESHLAPPPAQAQPAAERPFIPPQPERPVVRQPRMPRIEDLPLPAQAQLQAQREGEAHPEKRRMSLLERIASVGLGRKQDDEAPAQHQAPRQAAERQAPPPMPKAPPMPPVQRAPESRGPDAVSEYAKRPAPQRPAPQGLDPHGRPAPVQQHPMDDELEIPAFLRRQG